MLSAGSLADLLGRRRIFVSGLVVFSVASLLCGLSGTPTVLNLARALQGIGGAAMFSTSLALIAQEFHGRDRGHRVRAVGSDRSAPRSRSARWSAGSSPTRSAGSPSSSSTCRSGLPRSSWRSRGSARRATPRARASTGPASSTFSAALFLLVFALVRGNAEGWEQHADRRLPDRRRGAPDRVRRRRAAPGEADARPRALPQARVHGRRGRRLRAVGVDVRDVPLPHALHPELAGLRAARGRPALHSR